MSQLNDLNPRFRSMVRCGPGETWTHHTDAHKFKQFGWRATTKESDFEHETLIGNWNEERFDIERMKRAELLPSQYAHYFDTSYHAGYSKGPYKVPEKVKHLKERDFYAYPGHQPELDSRCQKCDYNSWATTSRISYIDPDLRRQKLVPANEYEKCKLLCEPHKPTIEHS